MADVHSCLSECIIPIGTKINAWNVRFDFRLILFYCRKNFIIHVIKRINNCCPYIVEIRDRVLGVCLGYIPVLACRSYRVFDQGTALSTIHGQPFLIPLTIDFTSFFRIGVVSNRISYTVTFTTQQIHTKVNMGCYISVNVLR